MKRLLCILSGMNAGGAETFLMKIYRNIDRTLYQMDFCINVKEKCFYEDEILNLGGIIYRIPSKSENLSEFKKQLSSIIRENQYDRVFRITSSAMGFMDLKLAKKAGAKICIARSSNSSDGQGLKSKIMHTLGKMLYARNIDVKIAPSDLAAAYTFGRRAYKNGEVKILHNAIDLDIYKFDGDIRKEIRESFNIDTKTKIIGHIGRFSRQKNHSFLLDVFKSYNNQNPNSVLMLVGGGELENEIRRKANLLEIEDKVIFTGIRSDIPSLLSAMDVFVFPSFYEGMPNTVIEAQATGLPCIIADAITKEANITGLVKYLPIGDADLWSDAILQTEIKTKKTPSEAFYSQKYDIKSVEEQFVQLIFK